VFAEEGGTFGAVFLVHSDENEQILKVEVGTKGAEEPQLVLDVQEDGRQAGGIGIGGSQGKSKFTLIFPGSSDAKPASWKRSEGNSLWFEAREEGWSRGGRISSNQEDLDLEYWWQNSKEVLKHAPPEFLVDLTDSPFMDAAGERTWILHQGEWVQAVEAETGHTETGHTPGVKAIAVQSADHDQVLCMAWPKARYVILRPEVNQLGVALEPVEFSLRRRYHLRGKVFLMDTSLEVIRDRIQKEITTR
jgi:hypothetical protein